MRRAVTKTGIEQLAEINMQQGAYPLSSQKRLWSKVQIGVFVVAFGILGSLIVFQSHAATANLSNLDCYLLGRSYSGGTCTNTCLSGAGSYVTSAPIFNYCSNAVSTSVQGTACTDRGRRLTAGGNGCARHWIQSASHYDGAPQCSGNNLSGGPNTYYVVSGTDYCKATPAPPPPPPPPPAPKVTLTASPTSVIKGASSTLTWSSQNATSCTASGSWSGAKAGSGSASTGALSANSSYTLTCTGSGGTAKATAAVTVTTPATPTGGGTTPTPPPSGSTGGSTPTPTTHPGSSGNSGSSSSSGNASNSNNSVTDTSKIPGVDTSVRTGTLSANASVSADGATSVYISYGATADTLTNSTDPTTFTSDPMDITLSNLQAKTTYYYKVIRTNAAGTATTSSVDSFVTGGYGITLHFVDASGKSLANIPGLINNDSSTITKSDENGDLKFYDLDAGSYKVKYAYNKLTYTEDFDTSNATDDATNPGQVAVLSDTINVSKLKNGSTQPLPVKKHSSVGTILLFLFLILLVGGIIVWLILRRRAKDNLYGTYSQKFDPTPVTDVPTSAASAMPLPPAPKHAPKPEDTSNLEHVGESLREMVIRSMHEEAQKRKQGPPGPTA